jgi:hypothetical protein
MSGKLLTTSTTLMCPHGGQAVLATPNTRVSADGSRVLLESDVHVVTGCPFTVGTTYMPCVRIEWKGGAGRTKVDGTAPLLKTSIGQCLNAQGGSQGVAVIVNTQQKASSQ